MITSVKSEGAGYRQATIAVSDPQAFEAVRTAIDNSLTPAKTSHFLLSLKRAKLRVRDFEVVLANGLLGQQVEAEYARLGQGDQGMIRELYLAAIEHVAPELREKFFKLYAYY